MDANHIERAFEHMTKALDQLRRGNPTLAEYYVALAIQCHLLDASAAGGTAKGKDSYADKVAMLQASFAS